MTAWATHLDRLIAAHGITADVRERTRGRANRRRRWVRVERPTTARRYAVALHEIGHVVARQVGCRVTRELQAWQWARAEGQAAGLWCEACDAALRSSLQSYCEWARARTHTRTDTIPDARAFILSTFDSAQREAVPHA